MKFKLNENETIADCLSRMKTQGYMPVKRIEKPVFQEQKMARLKYHIKKSFL